MLSPNQINPLGKRCYLEHIISEDGYVKDEMMRQVAKVKMNFQVLQEIRGKEQTSLSLSQLRRLNVNLSGSCAINLIILSISVNTEKFMK